MAMTRWLSSLALCATLARGASESCALPSELELAQHGCDPQDMEEWLSPGFVLQGYHVICVAPWSDGAPTTGVLVFKDGQPTTVPLAGSIHMDAGLASLRDDLASLVGVGRHLDTWYDGNLFFQLCRNENARCQEWASRGECEANPEYMHYECGGSCGTCNTTQDKPRWKGQEWRLFDTASGLNEPVDSVGAVALGGMLLLFEGGQFLWPGVRVGFRREVVLGGTPVVLETLALQPLVLEVESFLSDAECEHVIKSAMPHMAKSKVSMHLASADFEAVSCPASFLRRYMSHGTVGCFDGQGQG